MFGLKKQWGWHPRDPKGYIQGTKSLLLKGSHALLPTLGSSAKAAIQKLPRLYVKEIHLLILEHLLEGQGTIETLMGDKGTLSASFCFLNEVDKNTTIQGTGRCHFALSACPAGSGGLAQWLQSPAALLGQCGWAVKALSSCLAGTGMRWWLQHYCTPWMGQMSADNYHIPCFSC